MLISPLLMTALSCVILTQVNHMCTIHHPATVCPSAFYGTFHRYLISFAILQCDKVMILSVLTIQKICIHKSIYHHQASGSCICTFVSRWICKKSPDTMHQSGSTQQIPYINSSTGNFKKAVRPSTGYNL